MTPSSPGSFPSTHWSMILEVKGRPDRRRMAIEELFTAYWKPVYVYARSKGLDPDRAQDAVQGLFTRLLESDFVGRLDPHRGRLRSYLKTALDRHLIHEHERATAKKRGGGEPIVSLDFDVSAADQALDPGDPERAYHREWALAVIDRALDRLKSEFDQGQRRGPIEVALRFFSPAGGPRYADAAAEAGMSEAGFRSFLHRTRRRFKALVREEVCPTLEDTGEADAEVHDLLSALGS